MKSKFFALSLSGPVLFTFVFLPGPVRAGRLEEKIKALEGEVARIGPLQGELARLKEEQLQLKREATAAAAALPTFTYRPRGGVFVEAQDRSWGLRFRSRFHYRLLTWPDNRAQDQSGFSQFDLALRRVRPRINYFWDNRFYEFDMELDFGPDRSVVVQHGEFHVHFDRLNPYFPTFTIGPRVSSFFNRHDTNWGSSTGGLFDRSMFQDGAGVGAGTLNNAAGLFWDGVPAGFGEVLFQAIYSNQGLTSIADQPRPNSDKKSVHIGFNIQPFSKRKNKWLEGVDVGVGYQLDRIHPGETGRDFFRVRTTERQRLRLIEVARDLEPTSPRHYVTPGFGWKLGPYWLRTAFGWQRGEFETGGEVTGWMWRLGHELWLWSPKGFLTGSVNTPASVMFFTGFERDNYHADNNGLRNCNSVGGNCRGAYASNANVGLWYFIRSGLSVGFEYGHYRVNKIGRGADDLKSVDRGDAVTFNSLEFGMRFDF